MKGFFVTGTDTEVGKTAVSVALGQLLRCAGFGLRLIKPVQTGCLPGQEAGTLLAPDVEEARKAGLDALALHLYRPPCSPHLAADLAGESLACSTLARDIARASKGAECVLVEGAGGLYVPLNDSETMLDLAAALGLPVILVVGNRLGCLNHALLSLEALQARGLEVACLLLNRTSPDEACDPGCGPLADGDDEARILNDNAVTLARLGERRGVPLLADIPWSQDRSCAAMEKALGLAAHVLADRLETMAEDTAAVQETAGAESLLDFDRAHLWHPYTSATRPLPVREVGATRGNRLILADGRELVDGMSSWWCALHGYGEPSLQRAMTAQIGRMSHVMFGGLTHRPAVELGRRLLAMVPEGLEHIFYADSGSVAVEVALKMAIQYQFSKGRPQRQHFLAPLGGYHGDTQGAMGVCDPVTGMHTLFAGLLPGQYFVQRPSCRFDAPFDPASIDEAARVIGEKEGEIAAVILEPVVQGAGGMWFYHPDYLRGMKALCERHDILLIADEIATGFGRTGRLFACNWADLVPDIMCLGKGLTGGMMTGAATLTTAAVARGIGAADASAGGGVLMHGPTFMANPLFCATACASLDLLLASPWQERVANLQTWLAEGLAPCRGRAGVRDVRVLGAIGVVEAERPVDTEKLQDFFVEQGVWIRPFARNVYVMPPYITPKEDAERLCRAICAAVEQGLV